MPIDPEFPIHFFTIVLNGEPFIRYHIEQFKKLQFKWHWHVVEGLAELRHDTAWSVRNGATLPEDVVKDGRSVDGTAEYLDQLAREFPDNVTVYRAPNGRNWDGKLEMINAPMVALEKAGVECLLWEIDSDELWVDGQFALMRELFQKNRTRTAAVFYCWYFVGPNLAINRRRQYPEIEWRRAWRYQPGMKWIAHEPPILGAPIPGTNQFQDVAARHPFTPKEMEAQKLVFHHFAYVTEAQLQFKEKYYGYRDITAQWKRLQEANFPVRLKDYFNWPWVHEKAIVDPVETCGFIPLAHMKEGKWVLSPPRPPWELVPADEREAEKHRYITGWKFGYHLLPEIINRLDLKVGVEIGVAYGGHCDAILQRTKVQKLYGVDPYRHRPDCSDVTNFPQDQFDSLYRNTAKFMVQHKDRFELIREDSVAAASKVPDPVDFIYIDGDHSYDGVKHDLEAWYPKVREGGIIAGHDYKHPTFPGVGLAVHEFMSKERLEINAGEEYFWWVRKIPESQRSVNLTSQNAPNKRGILYVKWGPNSAVMERSIRSVQQFHPELPVHVHQLADNSSLLDKAALFEFSPFEETLFLDVDTVVLGRLDFGFEMAARHGLACCICENPWARRYGGIKNLDLVEYNTGVLFFSKAGKPIFDGWKKYVRAVDSSILFYNNEKQLVKMPYNDQAGFSLAVAEAEKPPFILPFNWNFRPSWHRAWWGPIKIWHDYSAPPPEIVKFTQDQSRPDAIMQFVRLS